MMMGISKRSGEVISTLKRTTSGTLELEISDGADLSIVLRADTASKLFREAFGDLAALNLKNDEPGAGPFDDAIDATRLVMFDHMDRSRDEPTIIALWPGSSEPAILTTNAGARESRLVKLSTRCGAGACNPDNVERELEEAGAPRIISQAMQRAANVLARLQ